MRCKEFNNYNDASLFRDKTDGQIEWCKYKGKPYWIVWYEV